MGEDAFQQLSCAKFGEAAPNERAAGCSRFSGNLRIKWRRLRVALSGGLSKFHAARNDLDLPVDWTGRELQASKIFEATL